MPRKGGDISVDNIQGKLVKLGNVVIDMHETARIIINGELVLNAHLPKGSGKECILILHKNATLIVNNRFRLCYDSVLQVFEGATLTLNGGLCNAGAIFAVKRNTVVGEEFLAARNFVLLDSDYHVVLDRETGKAMNAAVAGPVRIGKHVWCGINTTILKETTIGEGSVIGANAVVSKDVPPYCLAAGNPAKVIRYNITWKG
jgi:acetyltransferase-like isoleucine patch superfamily enzyme